MLGIGLGGFMEGWNKAQDKNLEREKANLLNKRYERQEVLDAREDAEYERSEQKRGELENIMSDSREQFDAKVARGEAKAEDSDDWFSQYTVPKLKQTYLSNGDMESADRVQKWADTADAKAGARLFKSSLFKAQNGDGPGALDDAIKAGQRQGYIAHGYEVQKHDKIVTPDGGLVGYRIWLKDPDGKEIQQDIQAAELPKTIATFLNPDAAWESQIAASQDATKRQNEIEDYRTKKEIDKAVGVGDDKMRGDAITSLRKRMDGGLAGDEAKFDDLPAADKERLISEEIGLQRGGPAQGASVAGAAPGIAGTEAGTAAPARKVLVDTATGQAVPTRPAQGPNKPATKPESREDNIQFQLQAADAAVRDGVAVDRVVQDLLANGIPEKQWPDSVKRAIANKKSGAVVGLGG
ncbi:unknown [Sinorhizobium phage PBC5]|uniref:virion structural protein n=1 Tax=Sinorhizobium phage PBC5 TaxID=179237 RepID=UPI000009B751|nr:virion structural protein [Sinorhizobium phage PBC5]AAL49577.1 unknown [Sinorhizobium phage PBC5]